MTKRILEILPSKSRHRWNGIQTLDTWLHVAMGDEERAIQSLREWRKVGGRVDLTTHPMVPASLFDNPDFQAINNEILAELAEQRANLARMEAAGELVPIPWNYSDNHMDFSNRQPFSAYQVVASCVSFRMRRTAGINR